MKIYRKPEPPARILSTSTGTQSPASGLQSPVSGLRPPASHGFTIIEIMVAVVLIALFATLVSSTMGKFDEDVKIAAALKEMKILQTTLMQVVYPDLGKIPSGPREEADDERKRLESLFVPSYLFMKIEAIRDMYKDVDDIYQDYVIKDYIKAWDVYKSRGWQGPYMSNPTGAVDATYFAPEDFPPIRGSHVYLDTMLTPWADRCEELAARAEAEGKADLAFQYRQGRFYHVVGPVKIDTGGNYVIPPGMGCIVSRGRDCLPDARPMLEQMIGACEKECCTTDFDAACETPCKNMCGQGRDQYLACMKTCMDACKSQMADNVNQCLEKRSSAYFKVFGITNPDDPGFVDMGDDVVISLNGDFRRSPMDK